MDDVVSRYLSCPHCAGPLRRTPAVAALRCPRGHSFDLARQGYVNLLAGRAPHAGDTAAMVAARADFLATGAYDFIRAALVDAARAQCPEAAGDAARDHPLLVLDAGAGTGWYLAAVLDALPSAVGVAIDVSKAALRRAARAHPRAGAVLADTWDRLPLADASAHLLLDVFAPRNGPEFRRVLRRDGALLVLTPADDHLTEIVDRLGLLRVDPGKEDRMAAGLAADFVRVGERTYRRELRLDRGRVATLVEMGPSAWHSDPAGLRDRLAALPEPVAVTAAVRLGVYRPR